MNRFTINAERAIPEIDLDPEKGVLSFRGEAYPEGALAFFQPVLQWVTAYLEELNPEKAVRLDLRIRYMNTSSTKIFMMLFDLFNDAYTERGLKLEINWYHHPEDELMREIGEDLSEDLEIPFHFLAESV